MQQVRALCVLAVIAFLAFLVGARGRAVDAGAHERYSTTLARLQTLDHRLAEDLMRARTGLLANYDPLVRTTADLRELELGIARVPAYLGDEGRRDLGEAAARSAERFLHLSELVERFKSENAVLLNSLRYLPIASEALAARSGDPSVRAHTDALVRHVLMLNLWSDSAGARDRAAGMPEPIAAELAALAAIPGIPGDELALVRRHTEEIVARRPSVDGHLAEIFRIQRERAGDGLDARYRRHHAAAARRSATDEMVLFALALTIVISGAAFIILRLRNSAQELGQTTAQLANAIDMKNRFVSMTSHEFRTPLSVILSSTELLEAYADRWTPQKKSEHFTRIRTAIQNMTQLIDGILLIGKGEAGVLDFKAVPVDLDRMCREVVAAVAAKTGGARTIDYEPPEVSSIVADERLIRHVLDNLLTNAIKYSPGGGRVALEASCDGREAVLVVSDEGIGIPEADRARLFESFQRAANVGAIPGTGLGLAVVKRAVDLHRGAVTVKSDLGAGSRFEVRLPVAASPTATDSGSGET
jgi:signal transduction histidine kinase